MDAFLVGPQQQLTITPGRYGHHIAVRFENTLKYLNKRDRLCVMTYLRRQNLLKNQKREFWLCAAAEVLLTEQKKAGDSVVLFVASSTASQFHCT